MKGSAKMSTVVACAILQKFMDGQQVQSPELEEACSVTRITIREVVRCKLAVYGVAKHRPKAVILTPANGQRRSRF